MADKKRETPGERLTRMAQEIRTGAGGSTYTAEEAARGSYRNDKYLERRNHDKTPLDRMSTATTEAGYNESDVTYRRLQKARAEEDKNYPGRVERANRLNPATNNAHDGGKDASGKVVSSGDWKGAGSD
jgi:hypothetical protein